MLKIYEISAEFPKPELYGLTCQLRSAALSVPSNIAEAAGRYHFSESVKFLFNARGSAFEVRSQLRAARDLDYISEETFNKLDQDYEQLIKSINAFIKHLRRKKEKTSNPIN